MTTNIPRTILGAVYAPVFGRIKPGPLCNFMILWCFSHKGYTWHEEAPRGWTCLMCKGVTVEFLEKLERSA